MGNSEKPAPKKRRKSSRPLAPTPDAADPDALLDATRRKKIAAIKKAVEDGSYRVSSDDVAQKLIEHMLQPKKRP